MQVITDPAKAANGVATGSVTELAGLNYNYNPENLPSRGEATAKIQNRP